jgi:hypothetical protein
MARSGANLRAEFAENGAQFLGRSTLAQPILISASSESGPPHQENHQKLSAAPRDMIDVGSPASGSEIAQASSSSSAATLSPGPVYAFFFVPRPRSVAEDRAGRFGADLAQACRADAAGRWFHPPHAVELGPNRPSHNSRMHLSSARALFLSSGRGRQGCGGDHRPRSCARTGDHSDLNKDVAKVKGEVNPAEQGETANIKQNTTNAGFFKGRRVK